MGRTAKEDSINSLWVTIYREEISRLKLGGRHQVNGMVENIVSCLLDRTEGVVPEDMIRDWVDALDEDYLWDVYIGPMLNNIEDQMPQRWALYGAEHPFATIVEGEYQPNWNDGCNCTPCITKRHAWIAEFGPIEEDEGVPLRFGGRIRPFDPNRMTEACEITRESEHEAAEA